MTTTLPGTPVAITERVAAAHHSVPAVLQIPETPAEHLRHAIMLLQLSLRDVSGVVHVAGPDYAAAMQRLQKAVLQLEGRVA